MKRFIPGILLLAASVAGSAPATTKETVLFVWAGDQARTGADSLVVVDFDEGSSRYGKILNVTPLPAPGASGNEPHHVGLSSDGRIMACGGLLSVLKGQNEIFFFDVSDAHHPRLVSEADPPQSAITDDFYALAGGGFLVTMMGGPHGHAPGRVAEFDRDLKLVAEYPASPPDDGFNPHGISIRPERNLMVTSDFICPSSTLASTPGGLELRGSVRVWDFAKRAIVRTVAIPGAGGTIDVRLIPGDARGRAYTAGMLDDQLYLIDTQRGTAKAVFDFAKIAKGGWPQLMKMTRDGKRLFITMNLAGRVAMLDTSNASRPKLLDVLDLGSGSGPHYIALSRDEKRLVITDYFLNEDGAGKVHAEGDHKIHVAKVGPRSLTLDSRFALDMNKDMPAPSRPHGVAMK